MRGLRIERELVVPVGLRRGQFGERALHVFEPLDVGVAQLHDVLRLLLDRLAGLVDLVQALAEGLLADVALEGLRERHFHRLAVDGYLVPLPGLGVAEGVPFGVPPIGLGRGVDVCPVIV